MDRDVWKKSTLFSSTKQPLFLCLPSIQSIKAFVHLASTASDSNSRLRANPSYHPISCHWLPAEQIASRKLLACWTCCSVKPHCLKSHHVFLFKSHNVTELCLFSSLVFGLLKCIGVEQIVLDRWQYLNWTYSGHINSGKKNSQVTVNADLQDCRHLASWFSQFGLNKHFCTMQDFYNYL